MSVYGQAPWLIYPFPNVEFTEFMTFVYLPIKMPDSDVRIPERLRFLNRMAEYAWHDAGSREDVYVYITAKHGFATPDNPLNRPGWHCDGFGTNDLNYVWWSNNPTRFALGDFGDVPQDHFDSLHHFDTMIEGGSEKVWVHDQYSRQKLYRLNPYVVHATPQIPEPGVMRSFVKISISTERYNLIGNSHNYLFDYRWTMHPRDTLRNDPARAQLDFVEDSDV